MSKIIKVDDKRVIVGDRTRDLILVDRKRKAILEKFPFYDRYEFKAINTRDKNKQLFLVRNYGGIHLLNLNNRELLK